MHVRVILPWMAPLVAVMTEVPAPTQSAGCGSAEVPMVATPRVPLVHADERVKSWVVLSLYVPVAMKVTVVPTTTVGLAGVTEMLTRVGTGATQVSVVLPVMALWVALMMLVPAAAQCTAWVVVSVPKVAWAGVPLAHAAVVVRFCCVPSLKVPVAMKPKFCPTVCDGLAGVTAMETKEGGGAGGVQVKVVLPLTTPTAAAMVLEPAEPQSTAWLVVARPESVATALELVHAA